MKNNKALAIFVILLADVLALYMGAQTLMGKASAYDLQLAAARDYARQELCARAVEAYEDVLFTEDTLQVRLELLEAYKMGLTIGELDSTYAATSAATEMVEHYRESPEAYESACAFLLEYGKYQDCAELLMKARDRGVTSEKIESLREAMRYQYRRYYAMYTHVLPEFEGMYTVETDGNFSFLDRAGSAAVKSGFSYASSFANGYAFVQTEEGDGSVRSFLIDRAGTRQVYLNDVETSSGVGKGKDAEGNDFLLLACKVGDSYGYYDLSGQKLFGDYAFAGRFRNDVAAVQETNGQWRLIHATGAPVTDKTFTEVILNEFDECAPRGFILVREGEKVHLYNLQMERLGNLECDEARAFVDGYAAIRIGDRWGFADTEGNVVIEPQYEEARSFSCGMGAFRMGEEWRFINIQNEIVIEESFEDVGYLSESGLCFVKTRGHWSYLSFYYTGK